MKKQLMYFCIALIAFLGSKQVSAQEYWFCVTNEELGSHKIKGSFGAVDLGREAARMMVLTEVKDFMRAPITIAEFSESTCDCGDRVLEVHSHSVGGHVAEALIEFDVEAVPGAVVETVDATIEDVAEVFTHPKKAIIDKPKAELKRLGKKLGF